MSDETPDTTGLREVAALDALRPIMCAACEGECGVCPYTASPAPAVVTPDASGVEDNSAARGVEDHPSAGDVEALANIRVLDRSYPLGYEAARAILASDWLANHVVAAREADRAEVEALRAEVHDYRTSIVFETTCFNCAHMLDVLAGSQEVEDHDGIEMAKTQRIRAQQRSIMQHRARAEAAEERLAQSESTLAGLRRVHGETVARLAGLVAKIEALANEGICTPGQCCAGYCVADVHDLDRDQAERVRDLFRALIPADAATALDAVREQAKAEERERIAQAIEAEAGLSVSTDPPSTYRAALLHAARIARGVDQ